MNAGNTELYDSLLLNVPHLKEVVAQTGYEMVDSLVFLHCLVKQIAPDFVLELGTGYGCSAIFMALADAQVKIISIDNYCGDTTKDVAIVAENLRKCNVSERVILIEGNTWRSGELVRERFDLVKPPEIVFMDASHSVEGLQSEYDSILGILPENHLIVVDDLKNEETHKFVMELGAFQVRYKFCELLQLHQGMAVLGTDDQYLRIVADLVGGVR